MSQDKKSMTIAETEERIFKTAKAVNAATDECLEVIAKHAKAVGLENEGEIPKFFYKRVSNSLAIDIYRLHNDQEVKT